MPTLGKVGIVDKGNYSASATYNSGDFVTYNGSTFLAIKDGVKGITPSDDKTNWKYLAKGFNEPAASGITVTDTHGIIDGSKGKKTFAQNLFDGIGNWIITKAVTNDTFVNKLTERLINNGTATQEGFALDARQGNPTVEGSLAKQISKLNEEKKWKIGNADLFIYGKFCILQFNNSVFLGTEKVPTEYCPKQKIWSAVSVDKTESRNTTDRILVDPDGTLIVQVNGLNITNVEIRGQITWYIN